LERGFRDRDYIQTIEDFFFTVVGNTHPPNRVTAYLKNIPSPLGKWGNGKKRYDRVLKQYTMTDVANTIAFLKLNYSEYVYHSKEQNITFSFVPVNKIRRHYKPEEKLAKLVTDEELDHLQLKAILLAKEISKESNVDLSNLGITGSLLVDIHRLEFSDIDLTVYGVSTCKAVKRGSLRLLQKSVLKRFEGDELDKWCLDRSRLYPLTIGEARKMYLQKWNRGRFRDTLFSIHPVKVESEISAIYGSKIFLPMGLVECEALVKDASDSMFLPAIYKIEDVSILNGHSYNGISEVVSYEGLYADIASEGERITCKGKLEKVRSRDSKKEYYRILVGSFEAAGRDYIKKKAWVEGRPFS
jgi:predicted nucleotidyltransferase